MRPLQPRLGADGAGGNRIDVAYGDDLEISIGVPQRP